MATILQTHLAYRELHRLGRSISSWRSHFPRGPASLSSLTFPGLTDFTITDRPEDDLDGMAAWRTFGGLTLDAAYERLREDPEAHQEAFMWMGGRAFAFYLPVVERYLREDEPRVAFDGIAHVLAHDLAMHVPSDVPEVLAVYIRLRALCERVLAEVAVLPDLAMRGFSIVQLQQAWRALLATLE